MIDEEYPDLDKVQIIIYLDFSEDSEKALETAWSVAEELLDHHIWVEIEPVHLWISDPLGAEALDLPKIVINGKTMFIGRAPSRGELREAILDRLGKPLSKRISMETFLSKGEDDGFREVVVIY